MNAKKLLSLWGLKWNPFSPELPSEALLVTARIENFAWRVEQLVQEGGFALIWGESGTGKSVALRIVAERLAALRDVVVGVLERSSRKRLTSIANWARSSRSSSVPRTFTGASKRSVNAGEPIWPPPASSPCC